MSESLIPVGTRVKIGNSGQSPPPPEDIIGQYGIIKAWSGVYGTGNAWPITDGTNSYIVAVEDNGDHIIHDDWLELE